MLTNVICLIHKRSCGEEKSHFSSFYIVKFFILNLESLDTQDMLLQTPYIHLPHRAHIFPMGAAEERNIVSTCQCEEYFSLCATIYAALVKKLYLYT